MPSLSGPPLRNGASPAEAVTALTADTRYPAAMATCATPSAVDAATGGLLRVDDAGVTATPSTRFALGSLTKAYTATLAAMLVQEDRIAWDRKIFDTLPELAAASNPAYANVTLHQLLAHRAGLPDFGDDAGLQNIEGTLREQRLQGSAWGLRQAHVATPGTAEAYSNLGFVIAASMLERAGDGPGARDYEASITRRVFEPLGIDAGFGVLGERASDAAGHEQSGGAWRVVEADAIRDAFPPALNPAGLIMATAADHGRFLQMHVRAGAGTAGEPLAPDQARVLHTPLGERAALGWLWPNASVDASLLVHNGTDGRSYMAFMAMSPRLQRACAVAVNGFRGDATPADLRQALLAMLGLAGR